MAPGSSPASAAAARTAWAASWNSLRSVIRPQRVNSVCPMPTMQGWLAPPIAQPPAAGAAPPSLRARSRSRRSRRRILPVVVIGKSSTNSISRGYW